MTLVATLDAARTLNPVSFDALVNDAVNAFSDHAKEEEKVRLPQLELLITQEENTVSEQRLDASPSMKPTF